MTGATQLRALANSLGGLQALAQKLKGEGIVEPVSVEADSSEVQDLFLAYGKVLSNKDPDNAGRLYVRSAAIGSNPKWVDCVSPVAGGGYGFFAPPGKGAMVLIIRVPSTEPPSDYAWIGCLYNPTTVGKEYKSQPSDSSPESLPKSEIDDTGMVQGDTPELSYGVPDEFMTYADDNTPGSYVLKHPAGHSMSLIEKNTEQRSVNEIKLKSAGNKKLRISDAPADSGGDCLQLIDERDNQVKISSSKDTIDVIAADSINLTTNKGSIEHTVGAGAGNFNVDVLGSGDERHVVHNGNFYLSCAKDFSVLAQQNARLAAGGVAYVTAPVQAVMDSDTLVQVQSKGVTNVIGKVAANYVSEGPCVVGGSTTTLTGGLLWSPLPPPIPFIEDLIDPPPTAGDRASGGTYDPANDHPGVVGDEPAPGVGHITLHYGQPPELPLEERFKDKHVRVDSSSISLQLFGTDPVTGDAFIKQALKMTDSKTQIQTINGFNGNRASQSKITVSPSEIKFFVGDTNKVTAWCEVTIDRMGMNIDGS